MLHWTKWWKNELTYKVTKYPSRGTLTKEEVDGETRAALSIWEAETNMKFVKKDSGKADIEISYVEGEHGDDPFDGPGKTLAHAFFPISGGDIHMDDEEDWTINSYKGTNLLWTLTHELGHSLGLKHTTVVGAVMFAYYLMFDPHQGAYFLFVFMEWSYHSDWNKMVLGQADKQERKTYILQYMPLQKQTFFPFPI